MISWKTACGSLPAGVYTRVAYDKQGTLCLYEANQTGIFIPGATAWLAAAGFRTKPTLLPSSASWPTPHCRRVLSGEDGSLWRVRMPECFLPIVSAPRLLSPGLVTDLASTSNQVVAIARPHGACGQNGATTPLPPREMPPSEQGSLTVNEDYQRSGCRSTRESPQQRRGAGFRS